MTRAQRLELLKQIEKDIHVCSIESTLIDDAKSCAIHSVIEELEQKSFINKPCVSEKTCEHDKNVVIDKIRNEIITRDKHVKTLRSDSCCFFTTEEVLEIVDKYK